MAYELYVSNVTLTINGNIP